MEKGSEIGFEGTKRGERRRRERRAEGQKAGRTVANSAEGAGGRGPKSLRALVTNCAHFLAQFSAAWPRQDLRREKILQAHRHKPIFRFVPVRLLRSAKLESFRKNFRKRCQVETWFLPRLFTAIPRTCGGLRSAQARRPKRPRATR